MINQEVSKAIDDRNYAAFKAWVDELLVLAKDGNKHAIMAYKTIYRLLNPAIDRILDQAHGDHVILERHISQHLFERNCNCLHEYLQAAKVTH